MTDKNERIESKNVLVSEPVAQEKDSVFSIGGKIKTIRKNKNISLTQIANETGYRVEFLEKIENGDLTPPVGVILQISRALDIESALLLRDQSNTANVNDRAHAYAKRTKNYAYTTLTPGAENKHLKAFRITLEPNQDHSGVGYQHEGEEFNYVLNGIIEVWVGEHVNTLKPGESLHFNSGIKHKLKNISDQQAELLVVIYTP